MFIYPSVPVDFDHLLSFHGLGDAEENENSLIPGGAFVAKLHLILFESHASNASDSDEGATIDDYVLFSQLVDELHGLFENRCWNSFPLCYYELVLCQLFCTSIEYVVSFVLCSISDVLHALRLQQYLSIADETRNSKPSDCESVVSDKVGNDSRSVKVSTAEIAEDTSTYCQLSNVRKGSMALPQRHRIRKTKVWAPAIEEGSPNDCDTSGLEFESSCLESSSQAKSSCQRRLTPEGSIQTPFSSFVDDGCASMEQKSFEGDNGPIDEKAALDVAFSLISANAENGQSSSTSLLCSPRRSSLDDAINSSAHLFEGNSSPCDAEKAESKFATRQDFTNQILNHLESVSEVLASYSDGLGKSEFKNDPESEKASRIFAPAILPSSNESRMANLEDGEVILESGEVVELAVHVFTEEAEQFYKMFRFYHDHQKGAFDIRHLVLTNQAVYVVNRSSIGDSALSFSRDFGAPYFKLSDISVGLGSQTITFNLAQGKGGYVVCTCSHQLTRAILSALEVSIRRHTAEGKSRPLLLKDSTKQRLAMSKWMSSELSSVPLPVSFYALVFWYPSIDQSCLSGLCFLGRSGFLYCRKLSKYRVWPRADEWTQDYFILRGQKLYQFEDSSCKVGKRVYNLREEVSGCREIEDYNYEFAFEVTLNSDGTALQFACSTRNEALQWMNSILQNSSNAEVSSATDGHCLACSCVLTDGYVFLGQETDDANFIRTLACLEFNCIQSVVAQSSDNCAILDVQTKNENNCGKWLLSFAAAQELHAFVKCLTTHLPKLHQESLDSESELSSLCNAAAKRWKASV
ncbi:hypothetical protein TTRE_0000583901 [Trichuris trichiura]|uniref:PH domain-containing protein n=1 Tax=Trichuris trichiura TaxID=36087 RepID=A0A077ZB23_TRITR|nr:hypothetical protein TTRE_0000583901 [Trichuris trichiura]